MKSSKLKPLERIVHLAVIGIPVAAWGQTPVSLADENSLAEITVTAQKRSQDLQQVPIAITPFSEESLRSKGITDLHQLSGLIPNVNLDQGSVFAGSSSILAASIRGIGQDDFAFNLDPGVGIYLDGVYFARTVGANQNLIDVERIEVLKGPQGTLFGRNTIGGAISIVTRTPGDVFFVQGQATGGSFGRRDLSLTADIPLAPRVLSSITFSTEYQDGYQKRIPYPSLIPYVSDPIDAFKNSGTEAFSTQGGTNQQVIRVKLLWKASEAVTATFTGDWTHANQPLAASTVLGTVTTGPNAVFGAFYNACIQGVMFVPTAPLVCGPRATVGTGLWQANLNPNSTRLLYGTAVTDTGNIDTTYANGPNFDRLDSYGAAATVDWDLDSMFKIRSITASRRLNWSADSDADGSPVDQWVLGFEEGQHQISQEIQLIGDLLDSRLKLVAGLYYFNEGGYINDLVTFGAGLIQIVGPNELDTTSYAEYLHADYKVSEKIGVTLGGRLSADRKAFTGGQEDLNQFFYKISGCYPYNASASVIGKPANLTCQQFLGFPNPQNPDQFYPIGRNHESFNEFTPTANLQYHLDDDLMAYLSFAKGFKSGGWTTRLTTPLLPLGSPAPSFGPETDKTYEFGLKSEWLNRQLIVNTALFVSNYDQIQLTYTQLQSPTTQNAGNAKIKGAEIELESLLGSHVSLNGNLGYMDAKYTEVNTYAEQTTGRYLPKTPRLKVSLSPDLHTHLANGALLRLGVDFTHTTEIFNDVQNTWVLRRPKEDVVNVSAAIASTDGKASLTIGGTNLTDRRFITTGISDDTRGVIYGDYSPPREWYATVGVKY
jgi:iron complex outermembrane receptor protein